MLPRWPATSASNRPLRGPFARGLGPPLSIPLASPRRLLCLARLTTPTPPRWRCCSCSYCDCDCSLRFRCCAAATAATAVCRLPRPRPRPRLRCCGLRRRLPERLPELLLLELALPELLPEPLLLLLLLLLLPPLLPLLLLLLLLLLRDCFFSPVSAPLATSFWCCFLTAAASPPHSCYPRHCLATGFSLVWALTASVAARCGANSGVPSICSNVFFLRQHSTGFLKTRPAFPCRPCRPNASVRVHYRHALGWRRTSWDEVVSRPALEALQLHRVRKPTSRAGAGWVGRWSGGGYGACCCFSRGGCSRHRMEPPVPVHHRQSTVCSSLSRSPSGSIRITRRHTAPQPQLRGLRAPAQPRRSHPAHAHANRHASCMHHASRRVPDEMHCRP